MPPVLATASSARAGELASVAAGSVLRVGSRGAAVRAWQSTINDLASAGKPMHAPIAVDGVYGPGTAAATEQFQRWAKLSVDGVVGPNTRAAATAAANGGTGGTGGTGGSSSGTGGTAGSGGSSSGTVATGPPLRPGNSGAAVRAWQSTMNDLAAAGKPTHAPIAVDGAYGPNTIAATKRFQRWAHLSVDGVVGPNTRSAAAHALPSSAQCTATQVFNSMSLVQRVGQLFVEGVDAPHPTTAQVTAIRQYDLGGVLLSGRSGAGVSATRTVTNRLQAQATASSTEGAKLRIATDQEGGQVQVLSGPGFSSIPPALSQGGVAPSGLRDRAATWAAQLRSAGVNLNLAPVLGTVPASLGTANEPIGRYQREFGHSPSVVSSHGVAVVKGMADNGIATAAKHFPGLGRVRGNTDTTAGVTDTVTTRHDAYLAPFTAAIHAGVPVIMVSTAIYARIDPSTVAAFSRTIVTGMLRGDLGFTGPIISDSLSAASVSNVAAGQRAIRFIDAGGTLVLDASSSSLPTMVKAVLDRANSDASFRRVVDQAARTDLDAKVAQGLLTCGG